MQLFWKYFFHGFGRYFNASNCGCNPNSEIVRDNIQFDFSKLTNDFTKVYNKITETKK